MIDLRKPKRGEYRRKRKAAKRKARKLAVTQTRPAIFERARNVCECCRRRPAQSMHEQRARSIGGGINIQNSIAVCGSGTTGCHGHLQQHNIIVTDGPFGRVFTPRYEFAARWMRGEE